MRDELYINGIQVELSGDTGIVLNFAAGDPSDMTAIASGSSYTVSLPLSAHNIQTLGFINHPGSTSDIPNKEHSARLVRGGIPIFENGKATVSGVGKTIDILLTWNRSDELEALSRAKMRDMAVTDVMRMDPDNFELSETAYLKWIWNTGYVVNARSGGLGYDVRGFRPAVKVSWLLGRMLPAFSIRADYWAFIERQWIMLPTMLGNSDILSKIGFSLSGSYNYNTSEDKKPDALNRVGSSYTPLAGGYNLYFPQINSRVEHDYIYTPKRGSYRFQGSVNAAMASNSSASFKIIKNRTIVTNRDGNVEEEYETLFEQTLRGSLVSFDTTKELEEGDRIGIIVSYTTAASNTVTLNMNVTFDALTAANTNTAYLLDYPIRENLPEISMLDFVKGVFGTIGLMTEHTIDGLHMFTADDVILSTDRKDISGMMVDEKETKLSFSRGLTKYNTLGYKDKTDYITFPADTYDKTEHAVVTLPFVLQDTIMYTKGDDKYNLTEGKDARLLLSDGTKSIQIAKRPTNGAVFTYRTLTLSSFTISGLEFETLADIYWRGYIGAFSVSPRIVTKRARLTPDFVQGLSFSKAIYDGQNYYMLLRVSDYNKYGLATLEMALIDGIELESVDLTNVILDGSGGVILFDGTTPALYEPPVSGSGSVSGKLIRELEEYTGDITPEISVPVDLGEGPARKRRLKDLVGQIFDILKTSDVDEETDDNVYSALRTIQEIEERAISKTKEDSAKEKITFEKGLQIGPAFAPGLLGGNVDERGNAELESLTLRKFLEVPELRYNRVDVNVGDKWRAPGGGLIESVDPVAQVVTLKLEDGEIGAVALDDICMGIFHFETGNATADLDDSKGNRAYAGFSTCYFRVTEIIEPGTNKRFRYALRPVDGSYPTQVHLMPGMHFVSYGNFTNANRQTSCYETRTYQRYLTGVSGWEYGVNNIAAQFGDLANLSIHGLQMEGYSAYLNNIYMSGTIQQFELLQPLRMEISSSMGDMLAEGESTVIDVEVYKGWVNLTADVQSWVWTRDSGSAADDLAWNQAHAGLASQAMLSYEDLGAAVDTNVSCLFHITATIKEETIQATITL